ncbi:MAG: hypothetical protein ACI865_001763 [Flavobacteriaceae bacterium]|jgi:hypothetical protein
MIIYPNPAVNVVNAEASEEREIKLCEKPGSSI